MNKLTVKDLERIYNTYSHFKKGYCCQQDAPAKIRPYLVCLGYNCGVYGWNWSLYLDVVNDTVYCSYYRNVPNRFIKK